MLRFLCTIQPGDGEVIAYSTDLIIRYILHLLMILISVVILTSLIFITIKVVKALNIYIEKNSKKLD